MKKRMLSLFIVLVLAMLLVVPVSAKPLTSVQGEIIPSGPDSGLLTGSLSGSYKIVDSQGQVSRLLFEGSVNGSSGTLLMNLVNIGPQGVGYWTILDGTGDLSSLHGQGTFVFPVESSGSYTGQVQ